MGRQQMTGFMDAYTEMHGNAGGIGMESIAFIKIRADALS